MSSQQFNRRKFLQLGGTVALASAICPSIYGTTMPNDLKAKIDFQNNNEIRLFSNENPYGPSKKVTDVILTQATRVNRYASYHRFSTENLKKIIAKKNGIETNQILLGHGSFEILCMLTRAYGKKQNSIIVPDLTFNVTAGFADKIFNHKCLRIPVDKDFNIDLKATKKAVTEETQLVYLCNPNNPTGKSLPIKELESFCKQVASNSCTVVIDEAYIDLVNPEARLDSINLLVQKYNVLVIRTFSKAYGLAGLRVGYAMGLPDTITHINSKYYNFEGLICNIGVAAAITAIEENGFVEAYRNKNDTIKSYTEIALKEFGIEFLPSDTNFIFLKVNDVKRFRSEMDIVGISPIPGGWSNYPDWARISIGTVDNMKIFMNTISKMKWLIES